jgi:hypothetical protein
VNGYAAVAFATPVAALLLGWVAVALHRRSLLRGSTPEQRAERRARRERELDEQMAALRAKLDEAERESALLRARLDRDARERAARGAGPDAGIVPTG